jgi:hypothetical protein
VVGGANAPTCGGWLLGVGKLFVGYGADDGPGCRLLDGAKPSEKNQQDWM